MGKQDRFAAVAQRYAQHRPGYPAALYDWIAARSPGTRLAWDAGAGSGQAAVALAERFDRVVATDASRPQLRHALGHPRVGYVAASSEAAPLAPGVADAVTAAAALHWFDLEPFYAEVRRVRRPGGILAAWSYHLGWVRPDIDEVVASFYFDLVRPWFDPRIERLEAHYRDIPFPFEAIEPPEIELTAEWSLADLLAFMGTWSGTAAYRAAKGEDPVARVADRLAEVWGEPETRLVVHWPLHIRVGRVG